MDGLWRNFEVGKVFDTAYRSTSDVRSYDGPNGDALIISSKELVCTTSLQDVPPT